MIFYPFCTIILALIYTNIRYFYMWNLNCSFGFMFAGAWWRNKCFKVLFYGRLWCNQVSSFTSMEDHMCALFPCIVSLLFFSLNLLSPKNVSVAIVHHWLFLFSCSNVLAGHLFGIPLRGTHSHAYVSSYMVSKIQFLLLMNKSYYICNNVISLEPYRASVHHVVSLVKQFFTTLVAEPHVVSALKFEYLFSRHTSTQIMIPVTI